MKRRLQTLFVIVALVLSSSSGALAAVLCAFGGHFAGQKNSCCPEEVEGHGESHAQAEHSAHAQAEEVDEDCESHARGGVDADATDGGEKSAATSDEWSGSSCTHCLGRQKNNAPVSYVAREKEERRRDHAHRETPAQKPSASEFRPFTPTITPKQGSPPGDPSRRRLMLSIFLI